MTNLLLATSLIGKYVEAYEKDIKDNDKVIYSKGVVYKVYMDRVSGNIWVSIAYHDDLCTVPLHSITAVAKEIK